MTTKQSLCLILHNIRSAYNVGSMFRTADAAGIDKIYLCGYSPTPDNPKVIKTSLGAEKTVPWEHYKLVGPLIKKLQKKNVRVAALEIDKRSKNIFSYKPKFPLALVVGHEREGVDHKTLALVDDILEIPMRGVKESLNVAVAAGVAAYALLNSL